MAQIVALVLAAIGGAFVHAAMSKSMLSIPPPDTALYSLTVAFIAFVNAGLFVSAKNLAE